MYKKIIFVIVFIIGFLLLNELYHGIVRQNNRNKIYKMAQSRAQEIKRKLVVFGDPYNGYGSNVYDLFMEGYGCGDETVDLTGCPYCLNGVKSDILEYLKKQESDSKVIFISCVLEYVDNIEEVINELYRVAGSIENIFIVTVNKYSLSAYFYQQDDYYAKNIIEGPPTHKEIKYKKILK